MDGRPLPASAPVTARHSPAPSTATSIKSSATTESPPTSSSPSEKLPDDTSKLKAFLGILRKFIGVSDIAAVRFSLPAQLLEPTPNLEYWHYLDRPETFTSIGDSEDDVSRVLEVLRFWFTKDLKYVKGKPCKPYNSVLGEFFRCNWDVKDSLPPIQGTAKKKSARDGSDTLGKEVKVSFLTEQTSHHPPVSAFFIDCPEKGISARGFDQISAKFTGTSVRVTPGQHNLGIFITLKDRDNEEYQLTHPAAHLGGILRGALAVTVADSCYITCPKTKLKVILHYVEEGWLGRAQNKVHGVIYRYDPESDNLTRLRDVPEKDIVARIEGNWQDKVRYTVAGEKESRLLVDLAPLLPVPKTVPPEEEQLTNESRRFWKDVTTAILAKQFSYATKLKQDLEESQRQKATHRKDSNEEWQPRFFTEALKPVGKPDLTDEGRLALEGMQAGNYKLTESEKVGA